MKLLTLAATGALALAAVQAYASDDVNATQFEKTTTTAYTTTQQSDNANIEPAAGPESGSTGFQQTQTTKSYTFKGAQFQQPVGTEKTRSNESTPEDSQ